MGFLAMIKKWEPHLNSFTDDVTKGQKLLKCGNVSLFVKSDVRPKQDYPSKFDKPFLLNEMNLHLSLTRTQTPFEF
jgi:hypothetical protein